MAGPDRSAPGGATPAEPRPGGTVASAGSGKAPGPRSWWSRLLDPQTAVLSLLGLTLVAGGGRRVIQAIQARRAVAALAGDDPDPRVILAAADHGRAALGSLFDLLDKGSRPEVRAAAGRALARLWRRDELIAEEERAIVVRGFAAHWHARRTYPRALATPLTIAIELAVTFLREAAGEVGPGHLRWSYRILGTQSARLEAWTEVSAGTSRVEFPLDPADFAGRGPHRLTLQARVQPIGLTDSWTLDLPDQGFAIEFDSRLDLNALLTLPDAARGAEVARLVHLSPRADDAGAASPIPLGAGFVLPDPPVLTVGAGLPCDLAHRLALAIDGLPGLWPTGAVIVTRGGNAATTQTAPLGSLADLPDGLIDRPGPRRIRVVLTADPSLGWAAPEIRSVWPEPITTDWVEVRILRA